MQSYSEYPGVEEGVDRRLEFPKIHWFSKSKFCEIISNEEYLNQFYPFIENKFAKNAKARKTFVGKSIPSNPNRINYFGSMPFDSYELIGTVYYSIEHAMWKLKVTHNGLSYDVENNFLVLFIRDPNSFFWSSNVKGDFRKFVFNDSTTAKYALRGAVDETDCKYNYIGRTIAEATDVPKRPKYYSNGWYNFDEEIPQIYGRINRSYRLMFAPLNSLEIGFDQFETLCLKASPAPLKILCRTAVRSYANYSQKNIKSLNNFGNQLIPESLIDFLKYPAYLAVGEFMLANEKLVKEDDQFELAFDKTTGNLVCRSLVEHDQVRKTDPSRLESVIARNVDLIWLHRLKTVFSNQFESIVNTIYSVNNLDSYRFCIEWETANYHIKTL